MLCLLSLCVWMACHPGSSKAPKILLILIAILIFGPISETIMNAESDRFPFKFDYFLYLIDSHLGVSAFSLARLFTEWPRPILFAIYQSLVYAMFLWYVVNLNLRGGRPGKLLIAYTINFLAGPCLYLIVPARGPRHAFGPAFPGLNPDVAPVLVRLGGWPNAIPSLHVSTALLLVLFAGKSRVLSFVAWTYLAGTIAATLAFEHYLIDLIVAVPFACFAALSAEAKIRQALGNLALVLAWLFAIRFATPVLITYPAVLRLLTFATVGFAGLSMVNGTKGRDDVLLQSIPTEFPCAASTPEDRG